MYIDACNIPKNEIYEESLRYSEEIIEKLYLDQKIMIEEQYAYLIRMIEELKIIEINNLTKYKDFFKLQNTKIKEYYTPLKNEILSGNLIGLFSRKYIK